jgi:hypothetical protein
MMPGGISAFVAGGDGVGAQGLGFQLAGMGLEVLRQVDAVVGQGQVGDGDAGGEVFQVDDRVL